MANINNKREWFVQLIDTRKKKAVNDDTGVFQVYTAGSAVRQAIYNAQGTLLTQDRGSAGVGYVSRIMTDGQLSFYTNVSCSTVDVSVLTASGRSYFLKALKPSNHRVDVDPEQVDFTLIVPIDDRASSTILRSSGFSLRKGMIVSDVYMKVVQVGTGLSTVAAIKYNVGVAGDSDAFLVGLSASVTGYKLPVAKSTTGTIVAAQQYGTLLAKFKTGNATNFGTFVQRKYAVPTATVLSFARGAALTHTQTGITAGIMNKTYLFVRYELDPTQSAIVTD